MWVVATLISWVGLCLVLSFVENPFRTVERRRRRKL